MLRKMIFTVALLATAIVAVAPSIASAKPCVLGKFVGSCSPVHVPTPNCGHCGAHLAY
jgi:hypothetical protein